MPIDRLLKTNQVAEALGVSVSTIKRWVDSGALRAARTAGRHRLVTLAEARRFASEMNLAGAALEALAGGPARRIACVDEDLVGELATALGGGRAREAREILHASYRSVGVVALADDLVRPVMERIGHGWEDRTLDVFQEHRATRIVESALVELVQAAIDRPRDTAGPTALGAAPEDDPYSIPGLLAELTLRDAGWEVVNLGDNLPLASLARAVLAHRPRLVWISASHIEEPGAFLEGYATFRAEVAAAGAAIIVGGQAATSELRGRLLGCVFGDRMAHLAEFARQIRPPATPARSDEPRPESPGL